MPIVQASEKIELTEVATIGNSVSYKESTVKSLMDSMRRDSTNNAKRRRAPKVSTEQLQSMGISVVRE